MAKENAESQSGRRREENASKVGGLRAEPILESRGAEWTQQV